MTFARLKLLLKRPRNFFRTRKVATLISREWQVSASKTELLCCVSLNLHRMRYFWPFVSTSGSVMLECFELWQMTNAYT